MAAGEDLASSRQEVPIGSTEPARPFGGSLERLPAAYQRAGLGWSLAMTLQDQVLHGRPEPCEGGEGDLPLPLATVEAWISDAVVSLAYDADPGTAQRASELWAKAFKEVRA